MPSAAANDVFRVAAPRVDPVDATGAGDSFDAGFLAARLAGEDLAGALALGCACGALSSASPSESGVELTKAKCRHISAAQTSAARRKPEKIWRRIG